jgi:hypothetical protein
VKEEGDRLKTVVKEEKGKEGEGSREEGKREVKEGGDRLKTVVREGREWKGRGRKERGAGRRRPPQGQG